MSRRGCKGFWRNENGATAALYALALPALVAVGGVGFDYARLAGMDSELQNAADQAALAGATQLDGKGGARTRAATAACTLVTNQTLLANDGAGLNVTSDDGAGGCTGIDQVLFWRDKDRTNAATSDADAHFVEVILEERTANYALTPVAGSFFGDIFAAAMAGLGSSICKVPPVFMCNPAESETTPGGDFDTAGLVGAGIRLLSGSPNFPGNFGFLDTDLGSGKGDNSTGSLAKALGWDQVPGDCSPTGKAGLKPGQREVVFNAFNTRFDISQNGSNTCPSGGNCSAAVNTRKDLVRKNQCGTNGNSGWQEPPDAYRPDPATRRPAVYPEVMGYPRDICHAVSFGGDCSYLGIGDSPIGDKTWDWDAYFLVNYGWDAVTWHAMTGLDPTDMDASNDPTRYKVYEWEKRNPSHLADQNIGGDLKAQSTPQCRPVQAAGTPDRRRISIAVVNCYDQEENISGNKSVEILKWVDVFLVEPAYDRGDRTSGDQIYAEVIGPTELAGGGSSSQNVRRDVPYLVR
jgi:Flp pilus assembly pilin Flp